MGNSNSTRLSCFATGITDAGRLQRFVFELDGLPREAKAEGAMLTLTAVAGDLAIEVQHRLD